MSANVFGMKPHSPLGPEGSWKTGQRNAEAGWYKDQFGRLVWLGWVGGVFPPTRDHHDRSVCGFWILILKDQAA